MAFDILSFAIGKAAGGGGGGSVEGVHFVTFMSEDGTTELYKRPVADGDDCADPVERGLISEPTKESTVQYSYTHVGWSATANGALDENILKAVTADKTVYANFAAVLRYYTVTYYDEDGTTVLKTESLAYGATPSYVPTKSGYDFVAWTPNATVTGDMSYTATWKAKPAFAAATWAEIAEIAESGNASSTFAIGNTRNETINGETITLAIVGFNHDDLADGSGKAGITIMAITPFATSMGMDTDCLYTTYNPYWLVSERREWLRSTVYNSLPSSLKTAIKTVSKISEDGSGGTATNSETLWIPSGTELFGTVGVDNIIENQGTKYSYFSSNSRRMLKKYGASAYTTYWTRSSYKKGGNGCRYLLVYGGNGTCGTARGDKENGIIFGFCI